MKRLKNWVISILMVLTLTAVFGWTGQRDLQDAMALAKAEPRTYHVTL